MIKKIFNYWIDSWKKKMISQMISFICLICCFFMLTISLLSLKFVFSFLTDVQNQAQFIVFFKDQVNDKQIKKVIDIMKESKRFRNIKYLSQGRIYEQIRSANNFSFFFDYDKESVPPIVQAHLKLDHLLNEELMNQEITKYKEEILVLPQVENVFYGEFWFSYYSKIIFGFRVFSLFLLACFLLAGFFITFYSIKNMLESNSLEIQLSELLGESPHRIYLPLFGVASLTATLSSFLGIVIGKTSFIFISFYLFRENILSFLLTKEVFFFLEFSIIPFAIFLAYLSLFLFSYKWRMNSKKSLV